MVIGFFYLFFVSEYFFLELSTYDLCQIQNNNRQNYRPNSILKTTRYVHEIYINIRFHPVKKLLSISYVHTYY